MFPAFVVHVCEYLCVLLFKLNAPQTNQQKDKVKKQKFITYLTNK